MSRFRLTTAVSALSIGLGMAGLAWAEAEPQTLSEYPFCRVKEENRPYPCRGANMAVVNSNAELLSIGGGLAPKWMRDQDREARKAAADAASQTAPVATEQTSDDPNNKPSPEERAALREQRKQAEIEARRAARQAERRAQRASEAAAASENGETPTDVQNEAVETGTVRSSDQDYATDLPATGQQQVIPGARKDGMSNFQKAVLVGMGALVVGAILSNGDEVVANSGDRVVVRRDGELTVLKNDDALLRRPGNTVRTETFSDGSSRTTVVEPDGTRVVTVRAADGAVLRRARTAPGEQESVLFDDTRPYLPVDLDTLPVPRSTAFQTPAAQWDEATLARALAAEQYATGRGFSLDQIRTIAPVRALAPEVEVAAITFATGSAAISPDQARDLGQLGRAIRKLVREHPETVLLIEGHTDATGDETYNLALSDRRAETVALALTEYFGVPPENMIVQGYGEQLLKVPTPLSEPRNRRAVVRNITALLNG